jgi:hypothetical protein
MRAYRAAHPERMRRYNQTWYEKTGRERQRADHEANPHKRRERKLRRYNITPEVYDALLESQGGVCAICGTDEPGGRGEFLVDHDHSCCPHAGSCGECVRGLLCIRCNTALGMFEDDPARLQEAINYLDIRKAKA